MSDDPPSETPAAAEVTPSVDHEATIRDLQASLASAQVQLSTQATKLSALSDLETELAQLKDQHSFVKAAKEAVEAQLQAERIKRETAEEASDDLRSQIDTLRGQVEAARRGVGILQKQEKERKRMSTIGGLGLSGGGVDALVEEVGEVTPEPPKSAVNAVTDKVSKRASMILGGVKPAHKRSSSISDGSDQPSTTITGSALSTSPNPQPSARPGLRELRLGATSSTPPSMYSPSIAEGEDGSRMPPYRSVSSGTIGTVGTSPSKRDAALREAVQKERDLREAAESAMRDAEDGHVKLSKEVKTLQRKLEESEEARLASDACLQALRDFIAGGGGAGGDGADPLSADPTSTHQLLKGISLPPLPTDRDADLRDDKPLPARPEKSPRKASAASWGFTSMFRGPASPAISTTAEPPATPQPLLSPPATIRTNSTRTSPLPTPHELDESTVENIPSATPVTWVSSWTKNVPSSSSTNATPIAPGPGASTGPGGEPLSPPLPPSSTRKLSSFFGFNRETKLPVSHEFDAHDAFTPEPPQGDHLEPSPMPNDDAIDEKPTPGTSHSALDDEVTTPALLSPRSQPQSVLSEDPKRQGMPEGADRPAVQA